MAETNPRSKLRSMKRQYFLVTFLLTISLFLVVYLPMEILFTIFEAGPYVRLGFTAALFVADYIAVNFIVNHKLQSRFIREAAPMLDTIQPPEPEYVMDEETARKLEETQRLQARKKNNTFFSRLYRSLAPTEDPEEELHPTSELPQQESDKKEIAKPNPKRKPELKQKKVKAEQQATQLRSRHADETNHSTEPKPSSTSSWQTTVEDMKTADYNDVVQALRNAGETIEPIQETAPVKTSADTDKAPQRQLPSRRRRRQEQKAAEAAQASVPRQESDSTVQKEKRQADRVKRNHTSKKEQRDSRAQRNQQQEVRHENIPKKRNDKTKKKRQPANRVADSADQVQSSAASNWSTPLDEMKTEELETAVEKAMRQGYNPISNERNK